MRKKYDVWIITLITIMTLALATGRGLTETNFSALGSRGGRRILFLVWGALVGSLTYLGVADTADCAGCDDGMLELLLTLSLAGFLCGLGLPYRPRLTPRIARLHVGLSMGSVICLVLSICRLLSLLERRYGNVFRAQKLLLALLQIPAVLLYLYAGIISSLLEIYAILGGWLYLGGMRRKIEKLGLSKDGNM